MASSRIAQQAPIGSERWIADESSLAHEYIGQEIEDFTYSVRNEVEWLNEHMAEIFDGTQFDVIEAFKTPGKLRGKTPHTARRVNLLGDETNAAPVFAQPPPAFKLPSPVQRHKINTFQVAEDVNDEHLQSSPQQARFSMDGKENAQSGPYNDFNRAQTPTTSTKINHAASITHQSSVKVAEVGSPAPTRDVQAHVDSISDDADIEMADADLRESSRQPQPDSPATRVNEMEDDAALMQQAISDGIVEEEMLEQEDPPSSSPSQKSTPVKSVLRKKSSLTFATLPARDPITTKKSMGPRMSRLSHFDQTRPNAGGRDSHLGGRSGQSEDDDEMVMDEEMHIEKKTEASKTSTQRLHERLAMLGKSAQPRPSKSIPSFVAQGQDKENAVKLAAQQERIDHDNDDDWIGPISGSKHSLGLNKVPLTNQDAQGEHDRVHESMIKSKTSIVKIEAAKPAYPTLIPGASTITSSPTSKLPVVSYPRLVAQIESTTPAGSPIRSKPHEGAISASKSKLFSVLKTAKGLFGGSTTPQSRPEQQEVLSPTEKPVIRADLPQDSVHETNDTNWTLVQDIDAGERTILQDHQQANDGLTDDVEEKDVDMPAPPPPKPLSQLPKPGDLRRPLRVREGAGTRPAPVSIKLASQRIGHGAQEALPMPSSSLRAPTLTKKASSTSIQTSSSTQSWKTASSTTRPKALEAAARKKEQEEREAERRAEQKRELERKRAAKAEEERRSAQEVEQKRALEAKNAAQRQAAEQRRAEAIRRNEQLRQRAAKAEPPAKRPLTRTGTVEDVRAALPVNKTKPAKRQFDDDADDEATQPLKQEPKRRRTSQLELIEGPSRPTMAPPIRPSNVHKDKYTQTFMASATTTAPSMFKSTVTTQHLQHAPKTPHYNDLAKFSSAKIPFADTTNPGTATTQKIPLKTPGAILKTPGTAKPSPQYLSGENIELPDIATDSDSDEEDGDKAFVPPAWANSPALRELLRQQQLVDPMQVFGPIAPLVMEEVFKGNKERQARFRNRTSSAVWTRDMLTADEVRRDREARERLEREGGWSFRPGQ